MVAYVYTTIIIVVIILVLFRMIKKKQRMSYQYTPDDNTPISYTPYDDITMGTQPEVKRDTSRRYQTSY